MPVIPTGYVGGTTLSPAVSSYETLADRIKRQLGAPLINIEIADEQIYDCITDSIEYFTKWAGYTEEYLVFRSELYTTGMGIQMDKIVNTTPELQSSELSGLSASMDYDLGSYRKVIDVFEFNQGESTGINTLFTLEQAMSQQIYSSYMVGNFGFDLVTWEALKGFIDTRKKVLAQEVRFRFDPRRQLLQLIPEPQPNHTYTGIVGCYIERPIKDLIKERWVQKYAKALTMIAVAHVRGKFNGMNMMGGGSLNANDLMQQGLKDKEELEKELMTDYVDKSPPLFYIA